MFCGKKHFDLEDIPDLTGKTAIITGANTGIGRVCALEMARKGCKIILACRTESKTLPVIEDIKKETGNDQLEFIPLDLLSLQSVTKFVETFKHRHDTLNILINNAGVMMCPFGLSQDGIETQFATNHVAHYYLTTQLIPLLEKSTPSRIVTVSSMGHRGCLGGLDLQNINNSKKYSRAGHYFKSKAANVLFTRELAKRLEAKGIKHVYANCNHPGVVNSDLTRHTMGSWANSLYNFFVTISTEDGATTQLYLATSPEIEQKNIKGQYYVPYSVVGQISSVASSDTNAKELWEFTENLLKEKVPGYQGSPI
ncbi:uncharacterized protein BX664DRAFT_279803 [Halteromyces radiatus]|uniref:uncharacterized protein n=1 Tax=Halteromyces radiatus TaxID=101107 RepID=UPI00221F5EAE|nr:uncharacterized protein BX664DRAFT_279803 [Halteromyces radiatus]KAI8089085.1 hypothetical protein BX664DRAFT_279803 [Halteromyces radiatus]